MCEAEAAGDGLLGEELGGCAGWSGGEEEAQRRGRCLAREAGELRGEAPGPADLEAARRFAVLATTLGGLGSEEGVPEGPAGGVSHHSLRGDEQSLAPARGGLRRRCPVARHDGSSRSGSTAGEVVRGVRKIGWIIAGLAFDGQRQCAGITGFLGFHLQIGPCDGGTLGKGYTPEQQSDGLGSASTVAVIH